jgi:toxin-antitoxin system PIN domain toxin
MILFDANVLIQAFRSDAADHGRYKACVESIINDPAPFGVSPEVLATVVKVCTHPGVFQRPSSLEETLAFCHALVDQPNAVLVTPGKQHSALFQDLCEAFDAQGDMVHRAWFTALSIESDCEWTTTDSDYGYFKQA